MYKYILGLFFFFGWITTSEGSIWEVLRKSELSESNPVALAYDSLISFSNTGKHGYFIGKKNKKLAYVVFPGINSDKSIVLLNGRGENTLKHAELIYNLSGLGFTIYSYDHRGQGFSDRLINSSGSYVDDFIDYVDDLQIFYKEFVKPARHKQNFVIAHSMGGAIATRFLEQNPDAFAKAVLLAPMIKINTGAFPYWLSNTLAWVNVAVGNGGGFIPGGKNFNPTPNFESNVQTHSSVRYYYDNYINLKFPELQMGSPTYQWIREAMKMSAAILDNTKKLKADTLVIQAKLDAFVNNRAQVQLCTSAAMCKLETIDGAFHETYNETEEIRDIVLDKIVKFLF